MSWNWKGPSKKYYNHIKTCEGCIWCIPPHENKKCYCCERTSNKWKMIDSYLVCSRCIDNEIYDKTYCNMCDVLLTKRYHGWDVCQECSKEIYCNKCQSSLLDPTQANCTSCYFKCTKCNWCFIGKKIECYCDSSKSSQYLIDYELKDKIRCQKCKCDRIYCSWRVTLPKSGWQHCGYFMEKKLWV